jgi:hypothetical protein
MISSKHAYMLIYARKEDIGDNALSPQSSPQPQMSTVNGVVRTMGPGEATTPPPRALAVVDALNAAHDEACDIFAAKYAL